MSGAGFLRRNTGLATHAAGGGGEADQPLVGDLAWYPLLALGAGLLLAGFFFPLAMIALPVELAALLAMLWQGALTGFRVESAMLSAPSRPGDHARDRGVGTGIFVLLLLVKLSALRQFFPEEAARAFVFCGMTSYCLPVLGARFLAGGGAAGMGRPGFGPVGMALGVWLGAVLLFAAPRLDSGWGIDPASIRPALVVAGASLFAWMLCLDTRRRWHGSNQPAWNREMFAGCLAAECGGLVGLLAARNTML